MPPGAVRALDGQRTAIIRESRARGTGSQGLTRDQYAGGGSAGGSAAGAGQDDVFEPQHVFVFVSQHCTPPASAGQPVAQSASVAHVDGQVFGAGAGGVDAGGNFVSGVGAGSAGATSSAGTSALFAQAVAIRRAVTANADFDKVAYFTAGTISDEL